MACELELIGLNGPTVWLMGVQHFVAKDLAPQARVNGVAPGSILWPEGEAAQSSEQKQAILERVPMGRPGLPEDIARTVCFLALDADYVTGQILAVDGGQSLTM